MKHLILFNKEYGPVILQSYDRSVDDMSNDFTDKMSDEDIASFISRNTGCGIERAKAIVKEANILNSNVVKNDLRQLEFDIKCLVEKFIEKHEIYPYGDIDIDKKPFTFDVVVRLNIRE